MAAPRWHPAKTAKVLQKIPNLLIDMSKLLKQHLTSKDKICQKKCTYESCLAQYIEHLLLM